MRRLLPFFLLLWCCARAALAQDSDLVFDGEPFARRFATGQPNGDKLVEFVRDGESLEQWTKLIAYRYQHLPRLGNEPRQVVAGMARVVMANNPQAQSRITFDKKSNEAVIDFLTWPPDKRFLEFNVFRYARSADGSAVLSLQLAYRFTDTSPAGAARLGALRDAWLKQAIAFDMKRVRDGLAQ